MKVQSSCQVYLLAAGRGRRAGGPKAWRLCDGVPLLERQLAFLRGRFDPLSIAVAIQPEWLERCEALDPRPRWVGVSPDASPLASLQALLAAAPLEEAAFVYHVDMRLWDEAVFAALEAGLGGSDAAAPLQGGKRGHPVILAARLAPALAALDPARARLDVFLRGLDVAEVPVASTLVHDNWNEPEAVLGR